MHLKKSSVAADVRRLAKFAKWSLLTSAATVILSGCATPQNHFSRPANLFPANGFITQRAVFSAFSKQYPLNGYLALSETGGKRLVVTEEFRPRSRRRAGKAGWENLCDAIEPCFFAGLLNIRRGLAPDLECIFGDTTNANCPVQMLSSNHFLLQRHFYSLDLRIVDVKTGTQPVDLFDETKVGRNAELQFGR